jgi:glycine/D-amino acid oxidase-like deaminating enzyme/nitrite reductase/ring-hydroxylating ferredoxin subunit
MKDNHDYNFTSGSTISFWIDNVKPRQYEQLSDDLEVDDVIVGGGIFGITTAYMLSKEGRRVALIEARNIIGGETGRTTAHITYQLDDRYQNLIKQWGEEKTGLLLQSHVQAVNIIEEIVTSEGIECDFERVRGNLFLYEEEDEKLIEKEKEAYEKLGKYDSEILERNKLINKKTLVTPEHAQFHPIKYLNALLKIIEDNGGRIFSNSKVTEVSNRGIKTEKHFVKAKNVVVCTNTPINTRTAIHTKQAAYRTYVVAGRVPRQEHELYWSIGKDAAPAGHSYYYIRRYGIDEKTDMLIVGGEDHKTGQQEEDSMKKIEEFSKKVGMKNVEYRWSGQVFEPADNLAFIGRSPGEENVYIQTGATGTGMTYSIVASTLIRDMIMGRTNPWQELYDPERKAIRAPISYIKENVNVAKQYVQLLTIDDELKKLGNEEGTVISREKKKIAAYKDNQGVIHTMSAICTHLGCAVNWNKTEKSFDCPCHGSRFTPRGEVISGPATEPLGKAE